MDIEQRNKYDDTICRYFDTDPYPRCMGQKNAPRTDCHGLESRCENISHTEQMKKNKTCSANIDKDMVNHPAHYTNGSIECIDALAAATEGLQGVEAFCTANAIKYLWRWKWKNGAQDLDKAIWYINHLKKQLAENN